MTTAQNFDVRLPAELAEEVTGKVRSGEYHSVDDVLIEGVRALLERDATIERWLRDDVVAGHAEYLADPSKAIAAESVIARIKARRAGRL